MLGGKEKEQKAKTLSAIKVPSFEISNVAFLSSARLVLCRLLFGFI